MCRIQPARRASRSRRTCCIAGRPPHINIFVDGDNIRVSGGLDAPVRDGAEVYLIPAVSGG